MFEAVIGIEIHCELKTRTKMFSGAPLAYGAKANTAVNEIDISMPGTLPQLNAKAVEYAVLLAKALQMEIDPLIQFDRKNYFYSDLPKGYQITQQFYPLGRNGRLLIDVEGEKKEIRINRLHMEEDTAKQFHKEGKTLIDFNRAGTPLLEIVSEADIRNGKEAAAYVDLLRLLVVSLKVSDGRMDEGSMRCDVNISLRENSEAPFGTKVEIKNLNSIANIQKAIEIEMKRQSEILLQGNQVVSQTLRFDEASQTTVMMRDKEAVLDYRYVTDPNIPIIRIADAILNQDLPELPWERLERYTQDYALSDYDASILVKNPELSDYFDTLAKRFKNYKLIVNWLTQDLLAVIEQKGDKTFEEWIKADHFIALFENLEQKKINSKQAKTVFEAMLQGKNPNDTIRDENMSQVSDEAVLIAWIEEVLAANPSIIEDYKKGLDKALKFVVGQVMKKSQGKANPALTQKLVVSLLDKK